MKALRSMLAAAVLTWTVAAGAVGWVGIPLRNGAASTVAVPDVVGEANFAAADAILGGVGLLGFEIEVCSAAANDEVVSQDPVATTVVALGSTVDVRTSNGVACSYDLSGIPSGWYSIASVLADQDFVREMREEATNGGGDWAYWLADAPRGTANLRLDMTVIRVEATSGGADWARWAPGTQPGNTANLQLNMIEALNADFQ